MNPKALILMLTTIFIVIVAIMIRIKANKPPDLDIMKARKMLAEAQLEKSPRFAEDAFQEASVYYDSAMFEWKNENDKFILFRDYTKAEGMAKKSTKSSEKAINIARENISNTKYILEIRIEKLGAGIKNYEEIFGKFPISKKHRDELAKNKLLYLEAIHAYENGNYILCKSKLDSVEISITQVYDYNKEKLIAYFKEFPMWNKMIGQTINYSKKNKTNVIIIDKLARELTIYAGGKIFRQYTVELGINWIGDKQQQGDKSTPEGQYKIIDKKQNGQTKYYKALLLDYPNEDDKKRFSLNKKNGIIKHDAKIGNLIEIHGNGGKGIDWTDGCIALTDAEMDEIFKLSPVGTQVTIVGSTKSLNELSFSLK